MKETYIVKEQVIANLLPHGHPFILMTKHYLRYEKKADAYQIYEGFKPLHKYVTDSEIERIKNSLT